MTLHHRQQAQRWGCIYHALYALTGDESLLDHVDDLSEFRALTRLHGLGLGVYTLHAGTYGQATPTGSDFWLDVIDRLPLDGSPFPLLLTVQAEHPGLRHAVAAMLYADEVVISDSALPGVRCLSLPAFLVSKYAVADEVQTIFPLDLDRLPVQDAQDFLGDLALQHEEARQAAYAM